MLFWGKAVKTRAGNNAAAAGSSVLEISGLSGAIQDLVGCAVPAVFFCVHMDIDAIILNCRSVVAGP